MNLILGREISYASSVPNAQLARPQIEAAEASSTKIKIASGTSHTMARRTASIRSRAARPMRLARTASIASTPTSAMVIPIPHQTGLYVMSRSSTIITIGGSDRGELPAVGVRAVERRLVFLTSGGEGRT